MLHSLLSNAAHEGMTVPDSNAGAWDGFADLLWLGRRRPSGGQGRKLVRAALRVVPPRAMPVDPDRPPMAAGDRVSWGLLTGGTSLAGVAYEWELPQ